MTYITTVMHQPPSKTN